MSRPPSIVIQGASSADAVPGIDAIAGECSIRCATSLDDLRAALADADVLLGWDFRAGDLERAWDAARRLRWIHWGGAGVDALLFPALIDSDVVVTNARGIFDAPMAEYVLGLIISMAKGFAETFDAQRERRWHYRTTERVEGRHALVVGAGSIGRAIARKLAAAGMRVTGVGRRARARDADFGEVRAVADLDALLPDVDYVVLIAPLTEQTRGMFGARQIEAMRPGARLVNVGRGALVDEDALARALARGRIAGAALDVFRTEPLPGDSPLWSLPGVIVSPHMSGDLDDFRESVAAQFLDNLRRYRAGEPLANVVDKRLGFVAGDG